jgi:hypothetical protein
VPPTVAPGKWSRRRPIGFLSAVSTTGGIAAPLLAGFSLTTVVQITGSQQPPPLADLAVASFAIAAAHDLLQCLDKRSG